MRKHNMNSTKTKFHSLFGGTKTSLSNRGHKDDDIGQLVPVVWLMQVDPFDEARYVYHNRYIYDKAS